MACRVGVVVFPGTNCEHDAATAIDQLGGQAELIWHGEDRLEGFDAVILPGGFAHGDYLRPGALARFSPVMGAVSRDVPVGTELRIPINHFLGSYVCDEDTLAELRDQDRVVLRYMDNLNGSVDDIAGIRNAAGNVVGLMPHPERAVSDLLGSSDGVVLLQALLDSAAVVRAA
jgi:phosphoribosylformylglycinamidine (FGAM) synthase-like amidotransferase family enzyme